MAILFDENDDFYSIADAAELTLPDGDWCIGIWTYVSDNAGEDYQYLLSNGNYSVNNSFNLFLNETNEGADPDTWQVNVEDGDGTNPGLLTSSIVGADAKHRLIITQRDASENEIQLWFCEPGAAATKEASVADTNFNAVNGGDWNIGRRVDGNADRYYGSIAAEFFKGNFCLTQAEIEALAVGLRPHDLGYASDIYLEMFTADATLRDLFNSNDATRNSAPVSVSHVPPMQAPPTPAVFQDPAIF